MGLFDAEARAIAIAKKSFSDDLAAIMVKAQLKGPKTITVFEGLSADEFAPDADSEELPGLGIYTPSAQSQAVVVGKRDWIVTVVFDFFALGPDARELSALVKFGAQAILKTVDRMVTDGTILNTKPVAEAGGQAFGVLVEIQGTSRTKGQDYFQDRVRVTVPVIERDEV